MGLQEAQGEVASTSAVERAASKARAAANSNVDVAAKSANAHAQKLGALAGQRTEAITGREQAATALAAHESKLNGRMKDVETAASALKTATAQLHEARSTRDAKAAERDAAAEAEQRTRDANQQARGTLAELEATAKGQAEVAAVHRKSAAASASGLGELCEKALNDPDEVMRALTASERELAGALERKAALAEAQERHIALSAQRTMLVKQAEAIPEAHRIDVATAREAAVAATADLEVAQTHRDEAVKSVAGAEERLALAMSRREERARCALRHKRLNKLKRLLGKEGLQGALVADALDRVSSHANAFLKRLTGGTLQLTVERQGTGDQLEVRAIDATCMREPQPVKALSGSQKFRCAVAIASGIGQYAGAGGMRSIVIDEGFASLDQESQKTMVEELKELATHMDKVIVVSHLESFAEATDFPHRIYVRTHGNASVIEGPAAAEL